MGKLPFFHHDFVSKPYSSVEMGDKRYKIYRQPYKGVWVLFWQAPTPEDIKIAQVDFDEKYPDCEECAKNLFVCECLVALEGFTA